MENSVLHRAMIQFDRIYSAVQLERELCATDRRFYSIAGAQWEGALGSQFENRPKFEINKIHLSVIRIINEYRQNRIDAMFITQSDGEEDKELADTCAQLYRDSESSSVAEEAYDNAFEEAVGGGFGAWKLCNEYMDDDDEDDDRQVIRFTPIYDADMTVFFDIDAKRQDKSDAKHAYIMIPYSYDAFRAEFGAEPSSFVRPQMIDYDWITQDVVWVAEYYEVDHTTDTVYTYAMLDGTTKKYRQADFDSDPKLDDMLTATGAQLVKRKKVKKRRIHKYILCASEVLEDCGFIAGDHIPIVPVYGKRWVINNIERCMGHVRLAKDAQRLKNMQVSKLAELAALSSNEKPILTPEQIAGHETIWANDNIENYPYLLINPITDASGQEVPSPPVGYTRPPSVPQPMAALLQMTETDIMDVLGKSQSADELRPNTSGVAVDLVQSRTDQTSYIYISNFAKAIKRSAQIWLGMAREIYIEDGRNVRGKSEAGENTFFDINQLSIGSGGDVIRKNDISSARFDVDVVIGPTSQSRKQGIVRVITGMLQVTTDPQDQKALSSFALMNVDGEGMADLRKYYRKQLLKMGAVEPTEEEAAELQQQAANAQPDANTLYLQSAAQSEQAKAVKAQADTRLALAKAEETQAKTATALADMDMKQREHVLKIAGSLRPQNPQDVVKSEGDVYGN